MTAATVTSEQQQEFTNLLIRGRDPLVFWREICGIEPNAAQVRWLNYVKPGTDGWQWRFKLVMLVAANQIGKTLAVAILILWACTYKIGTPADNPETWTKAPYQWFHVAPTQQQAYIPLKDISSILAGSHPAQKNPARFLPLLARVTKIEQYYDGLEFENGALAQFRTTEDKAQALQGRRANGISMDEAAFEDHLKSVVNETLMMRLISTGGPLFIISTPNGINDYYEMVNGVVQSPTVKRPSQQEWVDGEAAVVWATVLDNVGFGITQAEVDRMESTLDETTKEQQLRGAFLEPAEAFFVPSARVLEAFVNLPDHQDPIPGHRYVIFWDPSVSSDPLAVVVLDITKLPWIGVYYRHQPKPPGIHQTLMDIKALHVNYSSAESNTRMAALKVRSTAITGFDATSMGGVIIKQALSDLHPQRPLNFGGMGAVKRDALTNLRAALVNGQLKMPRSWTQMQRETLSYRLDDQKIKQDSVMALAGAASIAAKGFSGVSSQAFDVSGRVSQRSAWR